MSTQDDTAAAAVFHRAMALSGGLLQASEFGGDLKLMFERQLLNGRNLITSARNSFPSTPPIGFYIFNSSTVQAYAFAEDGKYFIGLSAGLILYTQYLFYRILADNRFLVGVGNPSIEIDSIPDEHLSPETFALTCPVKLRSPQDQVRANAAQHLADYVIQFIVAHEITHIEHGHVDYWGQITGWSGLQEFGWRPRDSEEAILRQTLEMDADACAASSQLASLRINVLKLLEPSIESPSQFDAAVEEMAFKWCFAVGTFFRVFGHDPIDDKTLERSAYPPWNARTSMFHTTSWTYIVERWPEGRTGFSNAWRRAISEVEHVYSKLTGQPISQAFLEGTRDGSSWKYAKSLLEFWKSELRDKLEPFAYKPLPA